MSWATLVLEYLNDLKNASGEIIHNITSLNFQNATVSPNVTIINDFYMPHTGVFGVQIMDLGAPTLFQMKRNGTLSYINEGTSLDVDSYYAFDFYANQSDRINFQVNTSVAFQLDLYWRRT